MKGSSSDQLQAKLEIMEFDLANIVVKSMAIIDGQDIIDLELIISGIDCVTYEC
jgi:hypothetical protein